MRAAALGAAVVLAAIGCASPEARRVRGSGPGADAGNRTREVEMHAGSRPYWQTPRLIEPYGLEDLEPARQAQLLDTGQAAGR